MAEPRPLPRLLEYMRPHRGRVWAASVCSVVNKLFDLAPPFLIAIAINVVIEKLAPLKPHRSDETIVFNAKQVSRLTSVS